MYVYVWMYHPQLQDGKVLKACSAKLGGSLWLDVSVYAEGASNIVLSKTCNHVLLNNTVSNKLNRRKRGFAGTVGG